MRRIMTGVGSGWFVWGLCFGHVGELVAGAAVGVTSGYFWWHKKVGQIESRSRA